MVKYLPRGVCGTVDIIKTSKASNGKFIYQLFYIMYIYVFHDITMRDASSVWLWCFEFFISVLRVIPLGIMRQIWYKSRRKNTEKQEWLQKLNEFIIS